MRINLSILVFCFGIFLPAMLSANSKVLDADSAFQLNSVAIQGRSTPSQLVVAPLAEKVSIRSIEELATVAKISNQVVVMAPGKYQMADYLKPEVIASTTPDVIGRCAMIEFSGSNNTFDFTNVTIEVDTKLLDDFKKHVIEFYVTGNNNHIKGLTINDIGNNPTFSGGNSFTVLGDNNYITQVTLHVSGSSPYGYGDLLGKGSSNLLRLKKHSGMLIEGVNDSIIGCRIISRAFGHCFFVQGGVNVYFENCTAEAFVRSTTEMLAETSGPAFDLNFSSVYRNRNSENKIPPGYTKSLSECGFRMYGSGGPTKRSTGAVTAVNCTAINTRIGFAFSKVNGNVLIKDGLAKGCEAGYNVDGVTIVNSKGDAKNGPLLYVGSGEVSNVELTLLPDTSSTIIHSIACIVGDGHKITLRKEGNSIRQLKNFILLGSSRPSGTNPFSPYGTANAKGIVLNNSTGMPIELNSLASNCIITSNADVQDKGKNNKIAIKK